MNMLNMEQRVAGRFSREVRADHPETEPAPHPRAIELMEKIQELVGAEGGASEAELTRFGFTTAELIEHMPEARTLLRRGFVRQIAPAGDRVPEVSAKAIDAVANRMPVMAAGEPDRDRWVRYCLARTAYTIDPWPSQSERCLSHLKLFLDSLPLLPRETNRILQDVAVAIKRIGRRA